MAIAVPSAGGAETDAVVGILNRRPRGAVVNAGPIRVVFWGTYDIGKPRVRLLLAGARQSGLEVIVCHAHVWRGVEDKSQLKGVVRKLALLARLLRAYPSLIRRYIQLPPHDAVIVGYPGLFDVLALWPMARMRQVPILWDVFMSVYDTIVRDRQLLPAWTPPAWALYILEWLAARTAALAFLDTHAHAQYFARLFRLSPDAVGAVPVGVESEVFKHGPSVRTVTTKSDRFTVLFYGQFIPLHGLDVVIDAAARVARHTHKVHWVIIGRGQEAARIDARLAVLDLRTVTRIEWVSYEALAQWIEDADVCLGIYGTTKKAGNVIPNKVYQAMAIGRRIVTSDTPAQRELLAYGPVPITFIPAGDSDALASAILRLQSEPALPRLALTIGADVVGQQLKRLVEGVVRSSA